MEYSSPAPHTVTLTHDRPNTDIMHAGTGLRHIAMVYVTHTEAIARITADPDPFIAALLTKAAAVGLDGFDIDYEPQAVRAFVQGARKHTDTAGAIPGDPVAAGASSANGAASGFMTFLRKLGAAMQARNLTLTIDMGNCPTFFDFDCAEAAALPGLAQASGT